MTQPGESSRVLWWGMVISLIIHVLLGAGVVRVASDVSLRGDVEEPHRELPRPKDSQPPPPPNEPKKKLPEVKLGQADSTTDSMTWLGNTETTEHFAKQSTVDQAALAKQAQGESGEKASTAAKPAEEQEAASRTTEALLTPVDPDAAMREDPLLPATAQEQPAQAATTQRTFPTPAELASKAPVSPKPDLPAQVAVVPEKKPPIEHPADHTTPAEKPSADNTKPTATSATQPEKEPTEQAKPTPPVQSPLAQQPQTPPRDAQVKQVPVRPSPASRPSRAGGGSNIPGLPSDKEALASAIKGSTVVRPGRVTAARGLEIKTVAPQWSYTTQRTQRPRNPVVYIIFGRDGKVKDADFVRDGLTVYNTGSPEVDEPLMTAIYSWRAEGKEINELKADDPDAGVRLIFTIMLGG